MGNKNVRRQGSQSPVSCASTRGILDAQMPFQQPTACEGPAEDVPHPLVNGFEPDVLAGPADGDVHPLARPPHAPVGTDVADLETVGVLKWRQCIGQLTRRGCLAWGRGLPIERFRRAFEVKCLADAVKRVLLGTAGVRWRSGGVGVERTRPPLMAAVLLRFTELARCSWPSSCFSLSSFQGSSTISTWSQCPTALGVAVEYGSRSNQSG